jgi:hypothetical protein
MSNIIEKLKVIIEKQTIELKVSIFNLPNVDDIITNILNNKEIHLNINIKDFDDNTGTIAILETNNNTNYKLLKTCIIKFLEDNISTFKYKPIYNYITLEVNANIFLLITLSEGTNSIELIEQWG